MIGGVMFLVLILGIVMIFTSLLITKIRIWKPKRTFWFAAIYLSCGIMAFIYLLFVSGNVEKIASDKVLKEQMEETEQLEKDLKNRRFESLKEEHLKFTETFEAKEENIEIIRNENSYYLPVVISWTDSAENKIEASYYETPLYLNRVYISPYVKAPKIEWDDNKLYIVENETKITAKSMRLSMELLNSTQYESYNNSLNELIGKRILHLNVPKQFNIIDNDGWY
ncbi:putative membrane protein [Solibacillus kalamii]|uniref:Glucose-6-phosphate isomerase n=1 Tax=Solibacillus kalamii TaxID=1748298 RepID=A0ABX3ZCW3_9BACL|nr:glucose-6-phosphate isomerase [Solibacillus kalamii]MBM7666944.1 putative membrane protein [Solibacillus kalamii]OUZ37486.1 glucose-6-phosphate isomerase [Solibacillus kalamii]